MDFFFLEANVLGSLLTDWKHRLQLENTGRVILYHMKPYCQNKNTGFGECSNYSNTKFALQLQTVQLECTIRILQRRSKILLALQTVWQPVPIIYHTPINTCVVHLTLITGLSSSQAVQTPTLVTTRLAPFVSKPLGLAQVQWSDPALTHLQLGLCYDSADSLGHLSGSP